MILLFCLKIVRFFVDSMLTLKLEELWLIIEAGAKDWGLSSPVPCMPSSVFRAGVRGQRAEYLTLKSCSMSWVSGCRYLHGRLRRCVWYRYSRYSGVRGEVQFSQYCIIHSHRAPLWPGSNRSVTCTQWGGYIEKTTTSKSNVNTELCINNWCSHYDVSHWSVDCHYKVWHWLHYFVTGIKPYLTTVCSSRQAKRL